MRIRITEEFRWAPPEQNNTWSQVYQPGDYTVKADCGQAAIDEGKAHRLDTNAKGKKAARAAKKAENAAEPLAPSEPVTVAETTAAEQLAE